MRLRSAPATVAIAFVAACGVQEAQAPVDLGDLRKPDSPPAYWLGERFEGHPLTANSGTLARPNLVYGTCEPAGDDGGCAPPLQLQHWPLAERGPGKFEITPGRPALCRTLAAERLTAAVFETTGGVELYVGNRVVVLFGERTLVRKAMRTLRPVRPQNPALPPPPEWVHEQLRRCAPPSPQTKLAELRARGSTVYWVGRTFEGHPLATAEADGDDVRLVYGECARDALAFGERCWAPLEIRVVRGESPVYADAIDCRSGRAQGAATALLSNAHTLDVFAGERTIRLIGRDLHLLRRAANALRPLAAGTPTGLPATPPHVVERLRERCEEGLAARG